jgi:DNA-directed RNA polymerase specialized sigma24 family protein
LDARSDSIEELAVSLFDRLYNFAHWLTRNREEAEDLVHENYAKALKGFFLYPVGDRFPGMDVSNLA